MPPGGDAGALHQLLPAPAPASVRLPLGPGHILHGVAQVPFLVKEPLVVEGSLGPRSPLSAPLPGRCRWYLGKRTHWSRSR